MKDRLLTFFIIGVLGLFVFIFFFIRNQPIKLPSFENKNGVATVNEPSITFVDPIRGVKSAKVTIVEYADFECAPCKQLVPLIDVAMKTYPDQVRLVWKDMPNTSTHPNAMQASIAAQCAARQGKFWEFHDQLFDRQSFLTSEQYPQIATDLKLDMEKFTKCFEGNDTLPLVKKNIDEGIGLGIVATPALYINGEILIGLQSVEDITQAIKKALGTNGN